VRFNFDGSWPCYSSRLRSQFRAGLESCRRSELSPRRFGWPCDANRIFLAEIYAHTRFGAVREFVLAFLYLLLNWVVSRYGQTEMWLPFLDTYRTMCFCGRTSGHTLVGIRDFSSR